MLEKTVSSVLVIICLVVACVPIGYYKYHWNKLEVEIDQLQNSIQLLKNSFVKLIDKDLSLSTKKLVRQFVHSQIRHCGMSPPPYSNLKAVAQYLNKNEDEARKLYLQIKRPKAHVTLKNISTASSGIISYWTHENAGITYMCHGVKFHDNTFLLVERTGQYYIYSQVKYKYRKKDKPSEHRHSTYVISRGGNKKESVKLFENSYHLGNSLKETEGWGEQISHQSGVIELNGGDRVYVTSKYGINTKMMEDKDTDSFFGLFMLP